MPNEIDDYQVFFGCSDFSGLFRGRAVSSLEYKRRLNTGCGWVPADQSLTPFGEIGPANPFGGAIDYERWDNLYLCALQGRVHLQI